MVHPGGLVNEEGGVRALCLGVDDNVKGTALCGKPSHVEDSPDRRSWWPPASADFFWPAGRPWPSCSCCFRTGTENRNVPRDDVAEVLLQSLLLPALKNRAVDLVSKPDLSPYPQP